jgi:hypothetical protein
VDLTVYLDNCATRRVRYNNDLSSNFHPTTCHEGTLGFQRYSSTLSLTTALDGGGLFNATHRSLGPREGATISFKRKDGCGASGPIGTGVVPRVRLGRVWCLGSDWDGCGASGPIGTGVDFEL